MAGRCSKLIMNLPFLPTCGECTWHVSFSQGSHRVEDILRMTVDLTPEELQHLLKGIEGRSRHNDKVSMGYYLYVCVHLKA